jgi:hypothetical protein
MMQRFRIRDKETRRIYRRSGMPQRYLSMNDIVVILTKSQIAEKLIKEYLELKDKVSLEYAILEINYAYFQIEELYKVKGYNVEVIRRYIKRENPGIYIYQTFENFSSVFSILVYENIESAVQWINEKRKIDGQCSTRSLAKECLFKGVIKNNLNYSPTKLENYYAKTQNLYIKKLP